MGRDDTPERRKILQLNEDAIRDHLGEMVRSTVEETLNRMLDAEADRLFNAEKYQRVMRVRTPVRGIMSASCIPVQARQD